MRLNMVDKLEKLEGFDKDTVEAARKVLLQKDTKGIWALTDLAETAGGFTIAERLLAGES